MPGKRRNVQLSDTGIDNPIIHNEPALTLTDYIQSLEKADEKRGLTDFDKLVQMRLLPEGSGFNQNQSIESFLSSKLNLSMEERYVKESKLLQNLNDSIENQKSLSMQGDQYHFNIDVEVSPSVLGYWDTEETNETTGFYNENPSEETKKIFSQVQQSKYEIKVNGAWANEDTFAVYFEETSNSVLNYALNSGYETSVWDSIHDELKKWAEEAQKKNQQVTFVFSGRENSSLVRLANENFGGEVIEKPDGKGDPDKQNSSTSYYESLRALANGCLCANSNFSDKQLQQIKKSKTVIQELLGKLQNLPKNTAEFRHLLGDLGEEVVKNTVLRDPNTKLFASRVGRQGIDVLFEKGGVFYVTEVKATSLKNSVISISKKAKTLSAEWVDKAVQKMFNSGDSGLQSAAKALKEALQKSKVHTITTGIFIDTKTGITQFIQNNRRYATVVKMMSSFIGLGKVTAEYAAWRIKLINMSNSKLFKAGPLAAISLYELYYAEDKVKTAMGIATESGVFLLLNLGFNVLTSFNPYGLTVKGLVFLGSVGLAYCARSKVESVYDNSSVFDQPLNDQIMESCKLN